MNIGWHGWLAWGVSLGSSAIFLVTLTVWACGREKHRR